MRVVQTPLGDGCASHCGVEHIGSTHHRERGEISAETPSANTDAREIEIGIVGGQRVERVHLIVEHGRGQIEMHTALPLGAECRCAATVGHDHGETLIGEPLRCAVRGVRVDHALRVRAAVRIHQHRQLRSRFVITGEEKRGRNTTRSASRKRHPRRDERLLRQARDHRGASRVNDRGLGLLHRDRRTARHHGVTTHRHRVDAGHVGEGSDGAVERPAPRTHALGMVGRVTRDHHTTRIGAHDRTHVDRRWCDRRAVDHQSLPTVAVGHGDQAAVVEHDR